MHAGDAHVTFCRELLHVHQLEDGRLPRAARPGEIGKLALSHVERDVVERQPSPCVLLADVGESDHLASLAAGSTADVAGAGPPSASSNRQLVCAVTVSNTAFSRPMTMGPSRIPTMPKVYTPVTKPMNIQ